MGVVLTVGVVLGSFACNLHLDPSLIHEDGGAGVGQGEVPTQVQDDTSGDAAPEAGGDANGGPQDAGHDVVVHDAGDAGNACTESEKESNDVVALATPIVNGTMCGVLSTPTDIDYYSANVVNGLLQLDFLAQADAVMILQGPNQQPTEVQSPGRVSVPAAGQWTIEVVSPATIVQSYTITRH